VQERKGLHAFFFGGSPRFLAKGVSPDLAM